MKIQSFLQALPKAELHLHLEGALPWAMVQTQHSHMPNAPAWWSETFRFADFTDFLAAIGSCYREVLVSTEQYAYAAQTLCNQLASQNVRYVEISFSTDHALSMGLSLDEVVATIKSAAVGQMVVRVFGGINRNVAYTLNDPLIKAMLNTPLLDGFDLHGDERLNTPKPYAEIYAQAQAAGLMTRAHAGEIVGPQSVRDALDFLGVKRIEHGTTAIYDQVLVERLAEEQITLDLCLTSNLKLGVVPKLTAHPICEFHRRGIPVTVNTDDPTIFGCSLTEELQLLVDKLGFSLADVAQMQRNAFHVANMPQTAKAAVLAEIDALLEMERG